MKRSLILLGLLLLMLPSGAQEDPWPMERQDRWSTGRAIAGPASSTQFTPWIKYRLGATLASHGPSIGQNGLGYFGSWIPDFVTKFNYETGSVMGDFDALNFVQSTPAIGSDGHIYFTTPGNPPSTPPGRVFALDPDTMDYLWVFQTNALKVGDNDAPSVTLGPDGDLVVPSTTGEVWRLDQVTGLPVWTRSGLSSAFHTIVFSRDDSMVYVSNSSRMTALSYATGAVIWDFDAGSETGSPGVAADGTLIFGCDGGTIFALNPNGTPRWTWQALGGVHHAPAFSEDGRAYIGSSDRRMYALDVATGAREWSFVANADIWQAAVVGYDGRIYFCDRFTRLYCISPSGLLIWSVQVPSSESRGPFTMGGDGTLYVAGSGLYAITQAFSTQSPESYTAIRGTHLAGSLADVFTSDDDYLRYGPGITFGSSQPPVELIFETTCPRSQLARLSIKLETGASTNNLLRRVYLRNYQAGQWTEIDSRHSTTTDSNTDLKLSTNLNRFVEQGSHKVRMRITWVQDGPVLAYPWNIRIDQVQFGHLPAFVYP